MPIELNETHEVTLKSWVPSANEADNGFGIQNLPFAVCRPAKSGGAYRAAVRIGDQVLDLAAAGSAGVFDGKAATAAQAANADSLNALMALGPAYWSALRLSLSRALRDGSSARQALESALFDEADAQYLVPATIGDYTDMYTSVHHATNIGRLFRPDNPLMPNFKWLPVGYHGRASSIGVSGQTFRRPHGQIKPPESDQPVYSACKRLDYELEVGIWIGAGNAMGEPIALDAVDDHVFGLCLLNDWSARDIQAWEYQPLGPFLAKNFATTISPWIVTNEALEPYRVSWGVGKDDPAPLAYLESDNNRARGGLDMTIESWIQTADMKAAGSEGHRLSHSTFAHSYWTFAQMVAHHTVGGCNLRPGDLIGTGTQSGPTDQEAAALIEITRGGREPVTLNNGQTRAFLDDGDSVTLRGWCERDGFARISLGECVGTVIA